MIVLAVEGVRKHYGPEPVLDGVTFEVRPGERIGLVGLNGSGKTTLLRILAGKEEADGGRAELHASVRVGYLEQQPEFEPGRTLWDEAREALEPLLEIQREAVAVAEALSKTAAEAEHKRLAARFDHLQHELHRHDAYNLDHKIERVLDGLGFSRTGFQVPVQSLSGGEQNRLMLAKLLLADPDLMLLDEPSNHLDLEATEWLEGFLAQSPAAMILVSHDRYFLDKVTNRTLELFAGTVADYSGNFSAYWKQKAERLLVERRTYERQQTEIAKTKEFIRRNAYGQKHAQAEDRRKKLARIVPAPAPREIAASPMAFPEVDRSGDIVLRVEGLAKAYDRPLFDELSFEICRGQRWAIMGPNGSGKTTLLRCLLGEMAPDAGGVIVGQGVQPAYFDQQLASLDDAMPVVDSIRPKTRQLETQQRRDLLARFGLVGDSALQSVGSLSGGQRCRAALAALAAEEANFLVLDEPTNHLDLWARESLERALSEFQGTVLFVSHDRFFIDRLADHLLVVLPDRFRVIEGNYQTYLHLAAQGGRAASHTVLPHHSKNPLPLVARLLVEKTKHQGLAAEGLLGASASVPVDIPPPLSEPKRKKRRFPYRKIEEIEAEIVQRETSLERLHAALASPEGYRDGRRARELKTEIADQQAALQTLYEHWEEAAELNW